MDIAGIVKTSLCDYPGAVASVIFTDGCNFQCPYCHNHKLIKGENERIKESTIFKFLEKRKGKIDAVVISGGEPCLQTDLIRFVTIIKSMGFKLKLDTNGSFPSVLEELIREELLDYVAMDIKSPLEKNKIAEITGIHKETDKTIKDIHQSLELLRSTGISYELRTTLIKEFHSENDIYKMALYGQKTYKLQRYNNENVKNIKYKQYTSFNEEELSLISEDIKTCLPLLELTCQ
ncbi:MAG: anaerobic ribonucleoside-triphosphate reductase activating protein [Marinifilaceae bacterium]